MKTMKELGFKIVQDTDNSRTWEYPLLEANETVHIVIAKKEKCMFGRISNNDNNKVWRDLILTRDVLLALAKELE